MTTEKYIRKEVLKAPLYHLDDLSGIKLNQNESPWDVPVELKAAVIENFLKTPWNRYPLSEYLNLKKKLSKSLGLWADNLVLANGSNVLIQALIMATSVGKKVMTLNPTFSVYKIEAELLGNEVIEFPLGDDFSLNIDAFMNTIKTEKPRIIFIANPNAPTGNLFDTQSLKKIIQNANCPVVIDEAYFPYSGTTLMEWVKNFDNLVVMRTFSKAYALAGVRLGYIACETEFARHVEKCLLPFRLSRLSIVLLSTLLDHQEYISSHVDSICQERDRVYRELLRFSQLKVYPSTANFLLFEYEKPKELFEKLHKENILVRVVDDGNRLARCLRVSIGSREENQAFLQAIQKIFN